MITDQLTRNDILQQWTTIQYLCRDSHRSYILGGAGGATFINETPPEELSNLPFVLGYAVLEQVLDVLIAQRTEALGSAPLAQGRAHIGCDGEGCSQSRGTRRRTLVAKCARCGAPGCYHDHESIKQGWPGWSQRRRHEDRKSRSSPTRHWSVT
jgi:hypothetical protein